MGQGEYQHLLQRVRDVKTIRTGQTQRGATGDDVRAKPFWPGLTLWKEHAWLCLFLAPLPTGTAVVCSKASGSLRYRSSCQDGGVDFAPWPVGCCGFPSQESFFADSSTNGSQRPAAWSRAPGRPVGTLDWELVRLASFLGGGPRM